MSVSYYRKIIVQNYQQVSKKSECPVCSNNSAYSLWDVNSKQAAQHFVLQKKHSKRFLELISHIEGLWGQNTCEVVQCGKCRFCYSNPYIAGDEKFYGLAYDRAGYPTWKWEFQLTYDILKKLSIYNPNLLEIGAGKGSFIKRIAGKLIPKENIFCTEFSKYGRQHLEKYGVKCFSEDVRDLSNPEFEESFDIVCMFQVLEHMDRLDALFQKLNWLIKSDGSLIIAVPNQNRIEFNELNDGLLDMPPCHIGRWNKKCFEIIGEKYGFHIVDYKVEKSGFPSRVKQFAISRFLRKSQQSGSFENQIQMITNHYLLRIMQIIGLAVISIIALPAFFKRNFEAGNSQWIHLTKVREENKIKL